MPTATVQERIAQIRALLRDFRDDGHEAQRRHTQVWTREGCDQEARTQLLARLAGRRVDDHGA